jgi:hypothetical protein
MIALSHISRTTQYSRCLLSWALLIFVSCHVLNQPHKRLLAIMIFHTGYAGLHYVCLTGQNERSVTLHGSPNRRAFTRVHQCQREKGSFANAKRQALRQIKRNVEKAENIIDISYRNPCIITRRISPYLSVPRMRVWRTLHTEGKYPYHTWVVRILPLY